MNVSLMNNVIVSLLALWGLFVTGFFVWIMYVAWKETEAEQRFDRFFGSEYYGTKTMSSITPYLIEKKKPTKKKVVSRANRAPRTSAKSKK